jgi:glycine/D-amino acid oxidase-like deaminating enzyme/nitrite reductase/ring-hydroxylating ferredoxin subunit
MEDAMTGNALAEETRSFWMEVEAPTQPALSESLSTDVIVVGGGMAGLSTAYELTRRGLSVVVIDRGELFGGMTSRTTAHLAWAWDDYYSHLLNLRGESAARQCIESQSEAIDRIEAIAGRENIACDFARIPGYLIAAGEDGATRLQEEEKVIRSLGFSVEPGLAPRGPAAQALCFSAQARFHPTKYLSGLVVALRKRGVQIFAHSPAESIDEKAGEVTVRANGCTITGRFGVVATNSPVNDRIAVHTKQSPYRSYVIAGEVPKGAVDDALFWDTAEPYHYVRLQPLEQSDLLIVGGEDHKSGMVDDGQERFRRLEDWGRRLFPEIGPITYRWSGQVYEPIDTLPHIGVNPGDKSIYVITGDSGQGITSAVVGSLLITQLITGKPSPWSETYEPSRKPLKAAGDFLKENATMPVNLVEHLTGGEFKSLDELPAGAGALLHINGKKVAAYKDAAGAVHAVSATCTHMGCIVHFNSLERCWDCPCHGSQFSIDGDVLAGPAVAPLAQVAL